jgi:ribosomal protein S18 acetylase RimI-like enzyme
MNKFEIINFSINYYDKALELWKKSEGIGLSPSDGIDDLEIYIQHNQDYSFLAFLDGEVVGTILAGHDYRRAYIYHFFVDDNYRKRGIGKLLLEKSLTKLKSKGIVKCHIAVYKDNQQGKDIWEKVGFKLREDLDMMSYNLRLNY